jgi:hypothetical protein
MLMTRGVRQTHSFWFTKVISCLDNIQIAELVIFYCFT